MLNNLFHSLSRHFTIDRMPSAEDIYIYSSTLSLLVVDEQDSKRRMTEKTLYLITMCTLMIEAFKMVDLNNYVADNYQNWKTNLLVDEIKDTIDSVLNNANKIIDKSINANIEFKENFPKNKKIHADIDKMYNRTLEIYKTINFGLNSLYKNAFKDK